MHSKCYHTYVNAFGEHLSEAKLYYKIYIYMYVPGYRNRDLYSAYSMLYQLNQSTKGILKQNKKLKIKLFIKNKILFKCSSPCLLP